jgi:hypothetical protein
MDCRSTRPQTNAPGGNQAIDCFQPPGRGEAAGVKWRAIAIAVGALLAVAASLCLLNPSAAQPAPNAGDEIAAQLGAAMGVQAYCNRPTAPIEAVLGRYIQQSGTGPIEADRLRDRMLSARLYMGNLLQAERKSPSFCEWDTREIERNFDNLFR